MWALKSFYHYSQVRYPLSIHLQGRVGSRLVARLRHHFPNAILIEQAEADSHVEQWLRERGYLRLLSARRAGALMMKVIDFILRCRASHLLAIDSDIIFLRRPEELLVAAQDPPDTDLFMLDPASSYNISESRALSELGINLAPKVNTGLMLLPRDERRLTGCEQYLAQPEVARPSGFIEQTLHALYSSDQRGVGYWPATYYISAGNTVPELSELVCRHYAGPSRRFLTDEGIPALIEKGFLNELRAR